MALLNTSDLITELDTIISGLSLSTEEEQRLATLLRSAVNVQEDPTGIISELQSRIEAIDNTVLLEKFALLMISLDIATTDRSIKVETVNDLPDSYTLPSGSIFLVGSIGVNVVAVGTKWLGLDGRLLRDDTPPAPVDAMSWGNGGYGRLGDGTTVDKSSPVTVVGGITNWNTISAGLYHSLGLTDAGILYAWSFGTDGRLGDGTTISRSSPVTVVGGITNWSTVSAGSAHNLGLTDTGVLYAWGANGLGRLGDGTTISRSSPVTVVGGITNWSAVSAGGLHNLGLTDTGILYAWGAGGSGRLGDGTVINRSSPVTVVGGITNWSTVSAGGAHNLAPVTVVGSITNWSTVSAGGAHNLGLTDAGIVYAWGLGTDGRLGDGTTVDKSSPVTVVGGITNWSIIDAGSSHSLGLTDTGVLYAWGLGTNGRLGDGTTIARSSPVTVVGGITNWSAISAGGAHSVALKIST